MKNNFEQNVLQINDLINNNQSIFSNFSFIFNGYGVITTMVISLLIVFLAIFNKGEINKNKFIYIVTSPIVMAISLSCFMITVTGVADIYNKKEKNVDTFYEYLQTENLENMTNKYSLKEIKLTNLYIPSYHIEYEKDGYFEKYKTDEFDFLSNSVDLYNINKMVSKNGNKNQTLINVSEYDEVVFLDNKLLKEELTKVEEKHNIDLSFIKDKLIKRTDGKLYKLNLKKETFNKMIEQGVDNL